MLDVHRVLLDTDADADTGCDVPVQDASLATIVGGIEQILIIRVERDAGAATVTALLRQVCDGGAFGATEPLGAGGWPVGADTGVDGADVIEAAIARALLGDPAIVRLVISSTTMGDADVLLSVDGSAAGAALRHVLARVAAPAPAPAASPLAVALLVATLGLVAWRAFRRAGRTAAGLVVLLALAALGVALAATITPDGAVEDWAGHAPLGSDATGDSSGGGTAVDLVAVFVTSDPTHLFVRIDVKDAVAAPPTATATASATETVTAAETATHSPTATQPPTATATPVATATVTAAATATHTPPATATPDASTATATATAGETATDTPTATGTATPADTATNTPMATATFTGTETPAPTATHTPAATTTATADDTATHTPAATGTATATPADTPTHTPVDTATATATPADTATATPAATATATTTVTSTGTVSPSVTATATATATPDALLAHPTAIIMVEGEDVIITLTGHSPDGVPLTFTIAPGPAHGSLIPSSGDIITPTGPTSATVHYAPHFDFSGSDSFLFEVSDGVATSAPATVSITVTNTQDDPTATDDAFTVVDNSVDQPLDVLANDDDAPDAGETLTISAVGTPNMGGTVMIADGGGALRYTPPANFTGIETFSYTIGDGNGGSAMAAVTVTVRPYDLVCSEEVCDENGCTRVPANEDGACDDDQVCTNTDACHAGFCAGTPNCAHLPPVGCFEWVCDAESLDGECKVVSRPRSPCVHPDPCVRFAECIDGLCIDRDHWPDCEP